jgi:hypothetical protein
MAEAKNALFEMRVRVRPGPNCGMPPHLIGADVLCFVGAADHLSAVRKAVEALRSRGFVFEDVVGQSVRRIDPSGWDDYLQQTWADLPTEFPGQAAAIRAQFPDAAGIGEVVALGAVAFGPFFCWETEAEPRGAPGTGRDSDKLGAGSLGGPCP